MTLLLIEFSSQCDRISVDWSYSRKSTITIFERRDVLRDIKLPYYKSRLHEVHVALCMKLFLLISSSSFGGALSQHSTSKCTGVPTFVARTDSTYGNEKFIHIPQPSMLLRNCAFGCANIPWPRWLPRTRPRQPIGPCGTPKRPGYIRPC